MNDHTLWQAKLAAYIHDPASKALILMRGMGHEKGSVAELRRAIFQDDAALAALKALDLVVKRADHWAAAADRPSLPKTVRSRVVFAENPALIHPLTGQSFEIKRLAGDEDAVPAAIEALNFNHFQRFLFKDDNRVDWRRTFLAFWRFGRIPPAPDLGVFWQELPADTRSPDHSIWEHVGLTSAFAGALEAGGQEGVALVLVSFGPVQGFIAQARSVSDLWAGSHFLSTMAWQGMKVICKRYGPDAILFPSLHGVPLADLWLRNEAGLNEVWPETEASIFKRESDANPLFAAALPNRFLSLVPAGVAESLAYEVTDNVRNWVSRRMDEVLEELGLAGNETTKKQVKRQLADFPEVNWSVVPWRFAMGGDGKLEDARLVKALHRLGSSRDYLDDVLGGMVKRGIEIEGAPFYIPNPGVAYPGLYDLAERLHAAAKAARPFDGAEEIGYRCSVCGEREWLTDDKEALAVPPGRRGNTAWSRLAEKQRIVKKGEHLCALCALKRFWPRMFARWAGEQAAIEGKINRYVVSTHTMALATSVWNHASRGNSTLEEKNNKEKGWKDLRDFIKRHDVHDSAALPHKLYRRFKETEDLSLFRQLPVLLDRISDIEEQEDGAYVNKERQQLEGALEKIFSRKLEAYYGMILMDGDSMGKWLAADEIAPILGNRFHPKVRAELKEIEPLGDYLDAQRPASPAWHQAISAGLNNFSVSLARLLVEEVFMGKLIYAGGDDLLAMVAMHDLPGLMLALRCAYSGIMPWDGKDTERAWKWLTGNTMPGNIHLAFSGGYGFMKHGKQKRLFRLMGGKATASMGAVVAHHKTPLARVLAVLRDAERAAKNIDGKDAFALALMKRSGGESLLLGNWMLNGTLRTGDMGLLLRLRDLLARPELSRRAAYILIEVIKEVPADGDALAAVIRHQLFRQGISRDPEAQEEVETLARELAARAMVNRAASDEKKKQLVRSGWHSAGAWLRDLLITAEFLAREGRVPTPVETKEVRHG